jgi:hypothetical protein
MDLSTHGLEGPISVSYGGHSCHKVIGEYLEAAEKLGFPIVDDANNFKVGCGFSVSELDSASFPYVCTILMFIRDGRNTSIL